MNKFYVYCHCFKDTNEIIYIGKGTGNRLKSKARGRLWLNTVGKREYYSMKIIDNLEENDAIKIEQELITELDPPAISMKVSSTIKPILYSIVSEIVEYDNTSPTFLRYRVDRANGAIKAGSVAGSYDSDGYGQIYIIDRMYKIHRVIYCLHSCKDLNSNLVIDHIDRNKSNNEVSNLRLVSISDNAKNIDWSVAKPSNTGERAISFKDDSFRVLWTQDGKQREKSFSYRRPRREKQEAFEEAIAFRNSLVDLGYIKIN